MSQLELRKFTIEDLNDKTILSQILRLQPAVTSPSRILSYQNNPRARNTDFILYIFKIGEKVIAYRSLLSDNLFFGDKKIHIAWFSGNYVIPEERRKGYSSRLLAEVEKDWGDRLFFSNFAWPSKYVLDQKEKYTPFCTLEGKRYYFRFGLAEILPPKYSFFKQIQGSLNVADNLLNRIRNPFKRSFEAKTKWEKLDFPEEKDFEFMSEFQDEELFRRGQAELRWIMKFPWIDSTKEAKEWAGKYHFSVYAHQFDLSFHRLEEQGKTIGFMMTSIRDGVMHVPYCYLKQEASNSAARWILQLAHQQNIHHLTVYETALIKILNNLGRYFLFSKNFEQAFLCNRALLDQYPGITNKKVHKGDGDAVFT